MGESPVMAHLAPILGVTAPRLPTCDEDSMQASPQSASMSSPETGKANPRGLRFGGISLGRATSGFASAVSSAKRAVAKPTSDVDKMPRSQELEGRRVDPQLGGRSVTFDDLVSGHESDGLSFSQMKKYWEDLPAAPRVDKKPHFAMSEEAGSEFPEASAPNAGASEKEVGSEFIAPVFAGGSK